MLRVFVGHDHREAVGLQAFITSLLEHASGPVDLTVITAKMASALGVGTDGTNAFTKARFLVPYLCAYKGRALWLDGSDMLVRGDIHDIGRVIDWRSAVQVVKHNYKPKAKRKYIGTEMEATQIAYPRKNWSSVMAMFCEHSACRRLTPEYVARASGQELHRFEWVEDERIGELPMAWNWLDEYGENKEATIVHFTNGIPGFPFYRDVPHSAEWRAAVNASLRGIL